MNTFRRYTADEVRDILQHAARHQSNVDQDLDASSSGLTLNEIEDAAREAGIETRYVRQAAARIDEGDVNAEVTESRSLNVPASDDVWEAIVAELRNVYQTPGSTGRIGTTREWTAHDRYSGPILVTLADDGAHPTLSISQHIESAKKDARTASATMFVITASITVMYLLGSFPIDVAYLLAALYLMSATLFGLGPTLETWRHQRVREKIRETLDQIELAGMRHATEAESEEVGLLSSDVLQDDTSTEEPEKERQRSRMR